MAATLYDVISGNSTTPAAPALGETARAQKLFQARSGKQTGTGSEPGISDISEKSASDQTSLNLLPVQQAAAAQGQQVGQAAAGIEQGRQYEQAQTDQARQGLSLKGQLQTSSLLQDLEQQKGQLDLEKDKSRLEQLAFGLRMQDQTYVDTLQREGARQRLDDAATFNEALQTSIFGEQTDLLQTALGGKSILEASDREFQKFLSSMSIDQAQTLAGIDLKHAAAMGQIEQKQTGKQIKIAAAEKQAEQKYGGINKLVSAGGQFAGNGSLFGGDKDAVG